MTLRRSVSRAGAIALVASAALLNHMSPAWAHGTGVTTGGHSNIDVTHAPENPLCLPAPRTRITLYSTGTFNDTPGVSHTATFVATEDYFFGPGGTYSDAACTTATAVDGTLSVTGGVNCDTVNATYQRTSSTYTITTTATSSFNCNLAGGGGNHSTSNLTYTGTQLACSPSVDCGNGSNAIEFQGTYSQT